jgi:hypothetical protein
MSISINDGALDQHETVIGTITFVIVNVNEGITLSITHTALSADEVIMFLDRNRCISYAQH